MLPAIGNYPRWRSDIAATELIREVPRLQWKETDARGRAGTHREGEGRPVEKWIDSLTGGDARVSGEKVWLLVADEDGGTRIALTEKTEIRNPLARFRARFVAGYAGDLRQLLDDLRKRLGE